MYEGASGSRAGLCRGGGVSGAWPVAGGGFLRNSCTGRRHEGGAGGSVPGTGRGGGAVRGRRLRQRKMGYVCTPPEIRPDTAKRPAPARHQKTLGHGLGSVYPLSKDVIWDPRDK